MKKMLICCLVPLLLLCSICLSAVQSSKAAMPQTREDASAVSAKPATLRILLLGRDRAAGLTDGIILLAIDRNSGSVRVLQLPRDTYAAYTDRDYKKLNGAYTALGADGTKAFLSNALGIPIHYTVVLELDAVCASVDAIGGVDVEIPQDMHYCDPSQDLCIDLPSGMQHINGAQAEQFLRFRSGYVNADLGRMDAQKLFLQAYLQKCQTVGVTCLLPLAFRLLPQIKTDLPVQEMVSLLQLMPQMHLSATDMQTAPGQALQGSSGAWYYSLRRNGMIESIQNLLLGNGEMLSPEQFDPCRVFDRADMPEFHNIYTASAGLPRHRSRDLGPSKIEIEFSEERKHIYGRKDDNRTASVAGRSRSRGAGTCDL